MTISGFLIARVCFVAVPIIAFMTVAISASYGDLSFALIAVLVLLTWAVWVAARLVRAALRRDWKKGVRIFGVALAISLCAWPIWLARDYLHLAAVYPFYLPRIRAAQNSLSQQVTLPWAETYGLGGGDTDQYLVYDPRHKLDSALGFRKTGDPNRPNVETRHLTGAFYICVFYYD